jgi:hypothetical protein
MKARDVFGKRIVAIGQERFFNSHTERWDVSFNSITLEDGSRIIFSAGESETAPYAQATYYPARQAVAP